MYRAVSFRILGKTDKSTMRGGGFNTSQKRIDQAVKKENLYILENAINKLILIYMLKTI